MKYNQHQTIREITPLSNKDCFYIADRRKTEFNYPIHTHAESELNFIANAPGVRRTVGDSVEIIENYDLTLISGDQLEHVWEQHNCTSRNIREITIQFSEEIFTSNFMYKNQFKSITKMLDKAKKGINFPIDAIMKVYSMLDTLSSEKEGFYAVMKFFSILYELSLFDDVRVLSSSKFANMDESSDSRRISKVYNYVNNHYKEVIRLEDLANEVGMTPISFSRFFKLRVNKTISDYIIDIRLGEATRLLVDTTQSIAEICYECGFNNLSNFNRIFKKKKDCSPKEFREYYRKTKIII